MAEHEVRNALGCFWIGHVLSVLIPNIQSDFLTFKVNICCPSNSVNISHRFHYKS